jgi:hypothetical protein
MVQRDVDNLLRDVHEIVLLLRQLVENTKKHDREESQ